MPDQVTLVREALAARGGPVTPKDLARAFSRASAARVAAVLDTLVTLGHARHLADGRYEPAA